MTFNEGHNAALLTSLERVQQARIAELERRLAEMEKMYDKVAADLIEALDVASAYRATASTMHQEIERRTGVERRARQEVSHPARRVNHERRTSWPR
jgi:electron transfer flavoprotein alpha/beta subunit